MASARPLSLINDENTTEVINRGKARTGTSPPRGRKALGNITNRSITNASLKSGRNHLKDAQTSSKASQPEPSRRVATAPIGKQQACVQESDGPVERYQGLPYTDQKRVALALENSELASQLRWMARVQPVSVLVVCA